MALLSPSSSPRRDMDPCDSPPADSLAPTSQGGSSIGAEAVGRKRKEDVDRMLAKLEKEGVEIDGKIASIIDDEIARIKAEVTRENKNEPKKNRMTLLHIIGCIAIGFIMGSEWYEHTFFAANAKEKRALEKLAKSSGVS
ncbi:hypothetical protein QOZ80_6BG0472040 [Eleusine coracana subsp. coracana]|nr:hypothetical protein QOZ80_6BG0472040 [Eleusine coracana subsp. coracana]